MNILNSGRNIDIQFDVVEPLDKKKKKKVNGRGLSCC